VLTAETEITKDKNPFTGAVFYECSVREFAEDIWTGLQYVCKFPGEKEVQSFYKNLTHEYKVEKQTLYLNQEIKIIGVNDFISPGIENIHGKKNCEVAFLELKKEHLQKKLKPIFKDTVFCYFGDKSKLSKKLNEVYQYFTILNIAIQWIPYDKKFNNMVLVSSEEENFLISNKNMELLIHFLPIHTALIYKKKESVILHQISPFHFWSEYGEFIL